MQNKIKIAAFNIASMAYFLNELLDSEHALYNKIRCMHRGIKGSDLYGKQECFEEQYILVEEMIHAIEKKIFQLGYFPEISLKGYLILDLLKEKKEQGWSIRSIMEDIEFIVDAIQENMSLYPWRWYCINKNFLLTIINAHKKISWMLQTELIWQDDFFTFWVSNGICWRGTRYMRKSKSCRMNIN
ncbi:MAG: ferritin-like domain-containing protein [Ferruginibacter sp.]